MKRSDTFCVQVQQSILNYCNHEELLSSGQFRSLFSTENLARISWWRISNGRSDAWETLSFWECSNKLKSRSNSDYKNILFKFDHQQSFVDLRDSFTTTWKTDLHFQQILEAIQISLDPAVVCIVNLDQNWRNKSIIKAFQQVSNIGLKLFIGLCINVDTVDILWMIYCTEKTLEWSKIPIK